MAQRTTDGNWQHHGDEPHLLREIVRTQQALMAGFTREVGRPASQFAVLRLLANAPQGLGTMDLARQLGINPAAVTRLVREMDAERLTLRRVDPQDRRRSYVRLSPKGQKLFETIHARSHELERSLATVLGADEMQAAARTLEKLRAYLEGTR
jgi:DNA-binding MarR family transcriptional regulator